MILYFNAAREKEISAYLIKGSEAIDRLKQRGDFKVSEYLLPLIDKLLKKNKIGFTDLKGIIIVSGPGPFTSIRIAVAVANTLSFALKIPVVGIENKKPIKDEQNIKAGLLKLKKAKVGTHIKPVYGGEANITRSKK
ncbi:tRNA (adenosine(37)-N6)-threonylcarbamoyltransferase complex dimerization subunit type 1 TsaB [Candidatus Falkowbacteria bacterium]|nr:tRNA (adenosine(37)-N6)-threonylcarbamoyltransferase complex dimerization subunit type 1 TsaB [Candidatus Falkowbacteria bacterium]